MVEIIIDPIVDFFFEVLYRLFAGMCVVIDFIQRTFYKLCGIEQVKIDGESTDLLTNLMESNSIKTVFLTITIIGVILLFVFTIIALIKANYQEKQNWKTVMTKNMHSFIIMIIVPFVILAGIMLTNVVMTSINQAMQGTNTGSNGCIGGQFLATLGVDSYIGNIPQKTVEANFISGAFSYQNLDLVRKYYNINDFNYIIALLGPLVIMVMFVLSALTFVQRIFDIVLLYIISPISISTIPLDEGNRFKVWKDMLISKVLSAYGVILVMNLFFLILPIVSHIKFFKSDFENGLVYIIFLIGGAFAVAKASRLISQLTGGQASGGEMAQMIYNIRSAIAFSKASKAIVGGGVMALVAGPEYKKMRKKGKTRGEAMSASVHSNRNQRVMSEKRSKAKQIMAMPLRMATMPLGMLSDLSKGGLIQVGKNFGPRFRNTFKGSTVFNRAEIKKKQSEMPVDDKTESKENDETNNQNTETQSDRTNESIKKEDNNDNQTQSDRTDSNIKKEDDKE